VRMVATSATRDASNAAEFTAGVTAILGQPPEVITGSQEARLSFAGATRELGAEFPPPYLVTDIGGGSTEFVTGSGDAGGAVSAISTDIGCVRLTERHLRDDPPTAAQVAAATADIDPAIEAAAAAVLAGAIPGPVGTLVGLAGSVTTVTALALGLPSYDPQRVHHARIPAARVHEVTLSLLGQTRAERAALGPMHPGRVDVIGAGTAS
jgi:exopolyphosphatase / guanosine-5'-triphosphate,3'-diphosphate pyrophosphatase